MAPVSTIRRGTQCHVLKNGGSNGGEDIMVPSTVERSVREQSHSCVKSWGNGHSLFLL